MKIVIVVALLLAGTVLQAQKNIPVTEQVSIEGKVKKPFQLRLKDAGGYASVAVDSIVISNHLLERRGVMKAVKGILLRDVIEKAGFDAPSHKELSEFYIECVATDNYKVVFSWNELFNSTIGAGVILITEKDGQKGDQIPYRVCMISFTDQATGRRFVKGLQKIIIKQVD